MELTPEMKARLERVRNNSAKEKPKDKKRTKRKPYKKYRGGRKTQLTPNCVVAELPNGVYFQRIKSDGQMITSLVWKPIDPTLFLGESK